MNIQVIQEIIRTQERETPKRGLLEDYALRTPPGFYLRNLASSSLKLGQFDSYLWMENAEFTVVILNKEGLPESTYCTCWHWRYLKSGEFCPHTALLIRRWAEKPLLFSKPTIPPLKGRPYFLPRGFVWEEYTPINTNITLSEEIQHIAQWLANEFKLKDLREIAKRVGSPKWSGRKAEIAREIVTTLFDEEKGRAYLEKIPPGERIHYFILSLIIGPHISLLEQNYPLFTKRLKDLFLENKNPSLSPESSPLLIYVHARVPVPLFLPWLTDFLYLPLATVANPEGEKRHESFSNTMLHFSQLLGAIVEQGIPKPLIHLPETLEENKTFTDIFYAHPIWASLPKAIPAYLLLFQGWETPPDVTKQLHTKHNIPPSLIDLLLRACVILGLCDVNAHPKEWRILPVYLADWWQYPAERRIRQLAMALIFAAADWAAVKVQEQRAYRFYSYRSASEEAYSVPSLGLLLQHILFILSLGPRRAWIPWREIERVLEAWNSLERKNPALYNLGISPKDAWGTFLKEWFYHALLLLAETGLVELTLQGEQITHVRFPHFPDTLFLRDFPLDIKEPPLPFQIKVDVQPSKSDLWVYVSLMSPPALYRLLSPWASTLNVDWTHAKILLTPQSVGTALQQGRTLEEFAREWEEISGHPLPAPLREYIERIQENWGKIRLYPEVVVIQFIDELMRQHVEMGIPELRENILALLDERTVVVDKSIADRIIELLEKSGYTPRRIDIQEA